jgi:hypothetical protein
MKFKARLFLTSLAIVLVVGSLPAAGCVTTDDLSGGGYETSSPIDPCTPGGFDGGGHPPLQNLQRSLTQILPSHSSFLVSTSTAKRPNRIGALLSGFLGACFAVMVLGQGTERCRRAELQEAEL